jgi:TolB protein
MNKFRQGLFVVFCAIYFTGVAVSQDSSVGIFEDHSDVGTVSKPGFVKYDTAAKTYTIGGSGYNMWFDHDAFQFVWKKMSGNVALTADIRWIGTGGDPHRKACLLIRQSLDANSAYVDAALHGSGLTSLQYRENAGDPTREIQSTVNAPVKLRIEKDSDYVFMSIARENETLHPSGGAFKIKLTEPFYVGLGVCAHDSSGFEQAVFSNVEVTNVTYPPGATPSLESTLETIATDSKDCRAVYTVQGHIEAPNWSKDGKYFIFNRDGKLYKLDANGGEPQPINTGDATYCNNDHGISPDGTQLAISDQSNGGTSLIYILPIDGGTPRLVTPTGPSYWHGWSPDGKTLAFCAQRNGEFDVYTIPAAGGDEKRLTTAAGLDDGPDYSPDGKYIYFNSERTGSMQIWRMNADGNEQKQITSDGYNNWFAHPSPDGQWIVFLSYEKDVTGHPANKDVMIRMMPAGGGEIQVLTKLFGGQGTINVPSWSPDSKNIAFVSYRLVYP